MLDKMKAYARNDVKTFCQEGGFTLMILNFWLLGLRERSHLQSPFLSLFFDGMRAKGKVSK